MRRPARECDRWWRQDGPEQGRKHGLSRGHVENVARLFVRRQQGRDGCQEFGPPCACLLQEGSTLFAEIETKLPGTAFLRSCPRSDGPGLAFHEFDSTSMRRNGVAAPGVFWIFFDPTRAFHLAAYPGPRINPISVCGSRRDAEEFGRLIAGQAREVTQLDQPGLDRITFGEPGQSGVECEQILIRLGRRDEVGMEVLAA